MADAQRTVIGTYNYLGRGLVPLQHFYSVRIELDELNDRAFVIFCSDIHVTRECQLPVSFRASEFSPRDILRDSNVQRQIAERYGWVYKIN